MKDDLDFHDSQFVALALAYAELVRELVDKGLIANDAMSKRLEDALNREAEHEDKKLVFSFLKMIKNGVTPE